MFRLLSSRYFLYTSASYAIEQYQAISLKSTYSTAVGIATFTGKLNWTGDFFTVFSDVVNIKKDVV